MNQSDVDIIYDYLHAKYIYFDGELYVKKTFSGNGVGYKVGSISYPSKNKGYAHLMAVFTIKGRVFSSALSHFIWIYHHKEKPKFLTFIDGNRMNCRIENLKQVTWSYIQYQRAGDNQGYKKQGDYYRVCLHCSDYEGSLGAYETPELAKEIYLLAKSLMMEEPLTVEELRQKLCDIHPKAKKPTVIKCVMPYAYLNKYGRFDCKFKCGKYNLFIGAFDTPRQANQAALEFKKEYKINPQIIKKYINKRVPDTGVRNVYKVSGEYFAQITIKKKFYKIGPFDTKAKAAKAYKVAKETGEFEVFDGNKIIQKPCSDCGIVMVDIKYKIRNFKKYCTSCKKINLKRYDNNRKTPKAKGRILTRDFKQYTLGYFYSQEESDKAYEQAALLYDTNIEEFHDKYIKVRMVKQKSPEKLREAYVKLRNKKGKLTKEQLKNENTQTLSAGRCERVLESPEDQR